MKRFALTIVLSVLSVLLSVQLANANPPSELKVQSAVPSFSGSTVFVTATVVGIGNADAINVQSYLNATCANGVTVNGFGIAATVTTSGGSQTVLMTSDGLLDLFGCDRVTSVDLVHTVAFAT